MEEGKYCENCHPNGKKFEDHDFDWGKCDKCKLLKPRKLWKGVDHKEELKKFIDFVLDEELPHEVSWTYATELKEWLEKYDIVPEEVLA